MHKRYLTIITVLCGMSLGIVWGQSDSTSKDNNSEPPPPSKVYVPYKELKEVFETEDQGVFLPYKEFQKLWRAAQGKPSAASIAPFKYLISTARFKGNVQEELATLRLELSIDILADGWIQVPIGLGEVAVSAAELLDTKNAKAVPLLRVTDGQYIFVTKGKGRYVLALDFVCQLETQPGLAVLNFRTPAAAITTLELEIPEENLKVDVQPMLAATTSQVKVDNTNTTLLQAFLGSTEKVRLSWKPKTEAAAELDSVIICDQFQHINVGEALISHEVTLNYNIHRGGVDSFTIQLPADFRVTDVSGANIARWDIEDANQTPAPLEILERSNFLKPRGFLTGPGAQVQNLKIKLFSAAKNKYTLTVKMERFLQESQVEIQLVPITTTQVLRQSGLIGITYSPRRLVHLQDVKNLARVDTGQLPKSLQGRPGVTAYRFITSEYSASMAIETTSPRISVTQNWILGVDSDQLLLRALINYKVERTGIFELNMNFPEPWQLESVGPPALVDDYQLKGRGKDRFLHILLKSERTGQFDLNLTARTNRAEPAELVQFSLPLADANNLQLYQGQLLLLMAEQLRAEVEEVQQIQAIPLKQAKKWASIPGLSPVMAFEFRAIDRDKAAGGKFKIAVKPAQVSVIVHRLVNIQPGSLEQEAIVQYQVRYAPVDTFYLKMPAEFADAGVQITGPNIKESPRIDELPPDQQDTTAETEADDTKWAYYKIVLQSKITGSYQLRVQARRTFQAGQVGKPAMVEAVPILAAGKLSDQSGHIAIAKSDTLAIGEPTAENLISGDTGSAADLPYSPHRRLASLAFKYNAPPFKLLLPVVAQKEATVFTTICSGTIIEQVLASDGALNTHATFMLATSQGDRLPITLPKGAKLTAVLLNGNEAPVEMGLSADNYIVRLPHSAGKVSKFVLEVSYGLTDARASSLTAPSLPDEIPVQQTLWRLWIPQNYYFLGYDRVFARLNSSQGNSMLRTMANQQPSQVQFKLPNQGRDLNFIRQGAPGKLSVLVMRKEAFSIILWVLIIAAGAAMLKLSGYHRVLIILAAGLIAGLIHLYLPLFVGKVVSAGSFAAVLVLLLWAAQWAFLALPRLREKSAAGRKAASQQKVEVIKPKSQIPKEADKSDNRQQQSEKDEE